MPLTVTNVATPLPPHVDKALAARIMALDPDRISDADVQQVLRHGPVPRIMLLHGGIFPVHLSMTSFGNFLVGMGYPEEKIRDPRSGDWSYSPYADAERLAGIAAWYYEHDRMPPMLIGHSQGGMQAIKVLYVFAGAYAADVPVWNPLTDFAEGRTSVRDPGTGRERPVVGLSLDYVSAVGAGGAAFLLPNQWSLLDRLHTIPDTVENFTGYTIGVDLWAWTLPTTGRYVSAGTAHVRNVTLSAANSHVLVPVTADFAADPDARAWIDAYRPDVAPGPPPPSAGPNLQWAADVWWSVKKHWALEAQRSLRAGQAAVR
ncbi:MAG: hypothetical protein ABI777_06600 [Betaproteobacteria bacterium]